MNNNNYNQGFTLVEVLVSLFILATAITGAMFVTVTNSNSASLIKDNYIASGLVQEGIEVTRNIRDNEWLASCPPASIACTFGTKLPAGSYRIQWDSSAVIALGANPVLQFDNDTGLYSYAGGNDTLFQRTVTISTVSASEKKIVVTVTWTERGVTHTVSAEDHLFAWR